MHGILPRSVGASNRERRHRGVLVIRVTALQRAPEDYRCMVRKFGNGTEKFPEVNVDGEENASVVSDGLVTSIAEKGGTYRTVAAVWYVMVVSAGAFKTKDMAFKSEKPRTATCTGGWRWSFSCCRTSRSTPWITRLF